MKNLKTTTIEWRIFRIYKSNEIICVWFQK